MAKKGSTVALDADETGVDFSTGESFVVDLNGVEDSTFEAIPKGYYNANINEVEFTYSQASGNPMWSLKYEIDSGEYEGRTLFSHMVFAGKGLPITKRHLSRIAPELLEGPFDPQNSEVIDSLLNRRVKLKVTIRPYEGEKRNNVADVFAAAGDDFG